MLSNLSIVNPSLFASARFTTQVMGFLEHTELVVQGASIDQGIEVIKERQCLMDIIDQLPISSQTVVQPAELLPSYRFHRQITWDLKPSDIPRRVLQALLKSFTGPNQDPADAMDRYFDAVVATMARSAQQLDGYQSSAPPLSLAGDEQEQVFDRHVASAKSSAELGLFVTAEAFLNRAINLSKTIEDREVRVRYLVAAASDLARLKQDNRALNIFADALDIAAAMEQTDPRNHAFDIIFDAADSVGLWERLQVP